MKLIGLHGQARVGKDTIGEYLREAYGFTVLSFATPLKAMLAAMFASVGDDIDRHPKEANIDWIGASPRRLMQTLGTEWGRRFVREDVWLVLMGRAMGHAERVVITDVRFENEVQWIRQRGGAIWHIHRQAAPSIEAHVSNTPMQFGRGDSRIDNDRSLAELYRNVDSLVKHEL